MLDCPKLDICSDQSKSLNTNNMLYQDCKTYNFNPTIQDSDKKCSILDDDVNIVLDIGKLYSNNKQNTSNKSNKCWGKMIFSDENNNYLQYMGVGIIENDKPSKYCCKITDYKFAQNNNNPSWKCAKINPTLINDQIYDDQNIIKRNIPVKTIIGNYKAINPNRFDEYDHSPEMNHFMNNMCCISQLSKNN